jgi:hypothetical protein
MSGSHQQVGGVQFTAVAPPLPEEPWPWEVLEQEIFDCTDWPWREMDGKLQFLG